MGSLIESSHQQKRLLAVAKSSNQNLGIEGFQFSCNFGVFSCKNGAFSCNFERFSCKKQGFSCNS